MKKLKFVYSNRLVEMEGKSHAALFRGFFDWWKEADLEKTIYGLFHSNLRLSTEPVFQRNVIKKNNFEITPELYIITHITPKIMDEGITQFLNALDIELIGIDGHNITEIPLNEEKIDGKKIEFEDNKALIQQLSEELNVKKKNVSLKELVEIKMQIRDENIRANNKRKKKTDNKETVEVDEKILVGAEADDKDEPPEKPL